jgi:hypothetical protein
MTIGELISTIQTVLKNNHQSTRYPDSMIYTLIKDARAELLRQSMESSKNISKFNWQTFCLPLTPTTNIFDCGCFEDDCELLQTSAIPSTISKGGKSLLKVLNFSGDQISYTPIIRVSDLKHTKHFKNKTVYTLVNDKITIYNNNLLKCIVIQGVFEDPLELDGLINVDGDGNPTGQCIFDKNTSDFPMDANLARAVRELVYKELLISYKLTQDAGNDGRDVRSKTDV